MTKAVTTTNNNLPAEVSAATWGAIEDIDGGDLLVPKIFHQQAMSKLVAEGSAKPGDFCDSLTGEILATKDKPLEVIIFGMYKSMIISKHDPFSNKFKLDKVVTITPENAMQFAGKPFVEETPEGQFKNNLQYNYYCLIPSKLGELPYVLSLGSTKTKSAKKINTILSKLANAGKPGAAIVFNLLSVSEKNDQGSWFGLQVDQGRASTPEEMQAAYNWYTKSKSQKFVAEEKDDHDSDDDQPNV